MADKPKVTIGITVVEDGKTLKREYHLIEDISKHFAEGGAIVVDLEAPPGGEVMIAKKAESCEGRSNHLNCKMRADCGGYRPVPVCQKIHQQGCYQELC